MLQGYETRIAAIVTDGDGSCDSTKPLPGDGELTIATTITDIIVYEGISYPAHSYTQFAMPRQSSTRKVYAQAARAACDF